MYLTIEVEGGLALGLSENLLITKQITVSSDGKFIYVHVFRPKLTDDGDRIDIMKICTDTGHLIDFFGIPDELGIARISNIKMRKYKVW